MLSNSPHDSAGGSENSKNTMKNDQKQKCDAVHDKIKAAIKSVVPGSQKNLPNLQQLMSYRDYVAMTIPPENTQDAEETESYLNLVAKDPDMMIPIPCNNKVDEYLYNFRVNQCELFLERKCNRHRPYTCFNWHFRNQKRRMPFIDRKNGKFNYSPDVYCQFYNETTGECPNDMPGGPGCNHLHRNTGDTERRYHLRYFKTSICIHKTDEKTGTCIKNGEHCAFAHTSRTLRNPTYEYVEHERVPTIGPIQRAHHQHSNTQQKQMTTINLDSQPSYPVRALTIEKSELIETSTKELVLDELCREKIIPDDPKWEDARFVLIHYKIYECQKPVRLCRQGYACPFYHNPKDRRRTPKTFKYKSTACPNVKIGMDWKDPQNCGKKDACEFCHTRTEQQFHPEIYKSTKCHDMAKDGYCPRGAFCAFAHTTPKAKISMKDTNSLDQTAIVKIVSTGPPGLQAPPGLVINTPNTKSPQSFQLPVSNREHAMHSNKARYVSDSEVINTTSSHDYLFESPPENQDAQNKKNRREGVNPPEVMRMQSFPNIVPGRDEQEVRSSVRPIGNNANVINQSKERSAFENYRKIQQDKRHCDQRRIGSSTASNLIMDSAIRSKDKFVERERSDRSLNEFYNPYTAVNHHQRKKFLSENFDGRYINEYSSHEGWSSHFTNMDEDRNIRDNNSNSFVPNDSPNLGRRIDNLHVSGLRKDSPLVNEGGPLDVMADSPKPLDPTSREQVKSPDFLYEDDRFDSNTSSNRNNRGYRPLYNSQREKNQINLSHSRDHIHNLRQNSESESVRRSNPKYGHAQALKELQHADNISRLGKSEVFRSPRIKSYSESTNVRNYNANQYGFFGRQSDNNNSAFHFAEDNIKLDSAKRERLDKIVYPVSSQNTIPMSGQLGLHKNKLTNSTSGIGGIGQPPIGSAQHSHSLTTSNSIPRGNNNSLNNLNNIANSSNNNFRSNNSSFSGLQAPGSNRSIFDQPDNNFDIDEDAKQMNKLSKEQLVERLAEISKLQMNKLSKEQLVERLTELT